MDLHLRTVGLAGALAALAALHPSTSARAQATCVTAPVGRICGTTDTATLATGTRKVVPAFKGIRYGVAPTGANHLRWRAPVPVPAWSGSVDAKTFGSVCEQKTPPPGQTMGEDCLFLNVWLPAAPTRTRVPVMVFIHGGAFVGGSGSSGLYDGAYLAASGNVVVVTLNYRLGALGFLYGVRNDSTIGGNLGLLDQQTALAWVRRNVGAFGGDSARVTVFGESAGAMSVGFHLFSMPASDSLFQAAIMESNPMGYGYRTSELAAQDGAVYLDALCTIAIVRCGLDRRSNAWLQQVDLASIRLANDRYLLGMWARIKEKGLPEGLPWAPMVDGAAVTGQPVNGYAAGMHPKPYVFGVNRDEGVVFASMLESLLKGLVLRPVTYDSLLSHVFGPTNAKTIQSTAGSDGSYPYRVQQHRAMPPLDSTAAALAQVLTDFAFNCANLASADSVFKLNGTNPIYAYRFVEPPFFNMYAGSDACLPSDGYACHAYELPYVFNTLTYARNMNPGGTSPTANDLLVTAAMTAAWTNFATTRQQPSTLWSSYVPSTGSVLVFQPVPAMQTGLASSANCSMWKQMPPFAPAR